MPNTTGSDRPRRWQVFTDAVARRTDDPIPAVWLTKQIGAKDKGTGYDLLNEEYEPKDFPRQRTMRAIAEALLMRKMDVVRLFARDLGLEDDEPSPFLDGLDSRAHTLDPQQRRAAHLVISLLCDQQAEVARLRALLEEHDIDAD